MYSYSRTLRNNVTLKWSGVHPYEYCPLGFLDCEYRRVCNKDMINFGSTFYVEMVVKPPRHKAIPLFGYQGVPLYDWIDIAIETKKLSGIDKLTFKNRYLNEILNGISKGLQKHKLMKMPIALNPVLLVRLYKNNDTETFERDISFKIKVKTSYSPLTMELESVGRRSFLDNFTQVKMHMGNVHFQTNLKLNNHSRHYCISLPGEYESVEFQFGDSNSISLLKTTVIQTIWLQEVYRSFRPFNYELPIFCDNRYFRTLTFYDYCIFLKTSNQKSYLFFRKYYEPVNLINYDNSVLKKWDRTWNEASELCESVGGHLPVFNSRDDLDEFLAIFKVTPYMPAIPAIYIGFSVNENWKVS